MEDLAQAVSEVLTLFASRADAAIVIDRQSRPVNPGRVSVNTNSSSQSSTASLACSEPNNSVTALMNAPSSRRYGHQLGERRTVTVWELSRISCGIPGPVSSIATSP
jgi:hypothetical protein